MDDRPLDVDQVMHDLRARVASTDPSIPLFTAPDAGGDAAITLRDTTFESPRAVVGKGITETKRTIVRAVWPVLHDVVEQINAALLEFRYVEDRLDVLEAAAGEEGRQADQLASLAREIEGLARRVRELEDLSVAARLAGLEAAAPPAPTPATAGDVEPIAPDVARLAAARGRIDNLGDERLAAYRALFHPDGPELDMSWESSRAADPLAPFAAVTPGSIGGIMALGLGDHLTADQWMAFARMAHAALRGSGGMALEMINSTTPAGLALRSRDPSLTPAVHPETVDFLLRAAGFTDVEVRYLGSFPDEVRAPLTAGGDWFDSRLDEMAAVINRLVVGQPIVAVFARK